MSRSVKSESRHHSAPAANPLNNAVVYGGGAAFEWQNFLVSGEYYRIDVNRQGLATNTFDGGYIEGSWILTGEQRAYSPQSGGYLRPVPDQIFTPWDGPCCGAFELAARFSTINLNDHFVPAPSSVSNSVGGGQQTIYSGAVRLWEGPLRDLSGLSACLSIGVQS